MHARTIVPCALLLLACPRPTDHDKTDGAADDSTGAAETTGSEPTPAPEPTPAGSSETGQPTADDACSAEIKALRDATDQVEQCVGAL